MNKNSKALAFSMLILAVFATAACILRTLACVWHLEENMIYFSASHLITAANIVVVMGGAALALLGFTMQKEALRANFSSPATYVPTGLVAVSLVFFGLSMLAVRIALESVIPSAKVDASSVLALITALLVPLSITHFFLTAFLTERHTRLRAYFSLATVLMLAVYASYLYFNTSAPLNAPNKVVEQMACLFAALFFLYETRISLGREIWRSYAAFGLVAALLTAYASVPALLTYFIRGVCPAGSVESAAMLFALFIFILARLCTMALSSPDCECPEMAVLRRFAERREEEMRSGKIEDGTQISITELIDIPQETGADNYDDSELPDAKSDEPNGESENADNKEDDR